MGLMYFEAQRSQGAQAVLDVRRAHLARRLATREEGWLLYTYATVAGTPLRQEGRMLGWAQTPGTRLRVLAAPATKEYREKVDRTEEGIKEALCDGAWSLT